MHSYEARPKALTEYTEKENAPPYGRISTHMPFGYENLDVFRRNDLLALMLNCLCHSALASGGFIETALPLRVTVARHCPAYDRFTVLWRSSLSFAVPTIHKS